MESKALLVKVLHLCHHDVRTEDGGAMVLEDRESSTVFGLRTEFENGRCTRTRSIRQRRSKGNVIGPEYTCRYT